MFQAAWWRLVRLGFRLLYNELAWTYDMVSWVVSLGQWQAWQRAAVPFIVGPKVLEIAHGPGHMLLALRAAGHQVTGLDLSPRMGRLARRRIRRAGFRPGWDAGLVRGRAQSLPFAAATFDTVLSTFPTEFVLEMATLRQVYRVLRPGGRFVIVPEGHLTGRGPLARFIEWLYVITGQRAGDFAIDNEGYWLEQSASWQEAERRLAAVGFAVEIKHVRLSRSAATVAVAVIQA